MSHEPMHKVIKLKRYEQPPEGYYEDFLREFHRRQRAELLNPSLSTLLLERLSGLFSELRVPAMAFAGAAVIAVIASIAIIRETPRLEPARAYSVSYTPTVPYSQVPVTIQNVQNMQPVSLRLETPTSSHPQGGSMLFPPSYLLQARPANHESPLSF